MLKPIYDSPFVLPALPWLAAPLVLAWALRTRTTIGRLVAAFAVVIAFDAWLTGTYSPVHAPPSLDWVVPVAFVIAGDLRYFLMLEACREPRSSGFASALRATALAFVVPVTTQIARVLFARVHDDPTINYLVYELLFLALAIGMRVLVVPRIARDATPVMARLARGLTAFEIVQYGLWSCADVLITNGASEAGFGLRIVPNVLYYVAFLPVALWLSRSERSSA